jgi:hypothetical protein
MSASETDDDLPPSMIHGISIDSTDENKRSFDTILKKVHTRLTTLTYLSEVSRRLSTEWWLSGFLHQGEEAQNK